MKYLLGLILCFFILSSIYAQNEVAKAMLEMEKRMIDFEVSKVDTQYYENNNIQKLFYYDFDKRLRRTITFNGLGGIKRILNRNQKDELDGVLLEFYDSENLKSFSLHNKNVGFTYDYYEDGRIKKYYQSYNTYDVGYEVVFCSEGQLYYEAFHDSLDYVKQGFHCNGNLRFKGRIINNNQKEGIWVYWNEESVLIKEEHWDKGILIKENDNGLPDKSEK